ncbi:MAG: class I SAM-dependent methyltransferase family protein [Candidatus Wukongarchaeota archaeon]|nr:class I SAM-dependent methyltransferase family protein [Candidatus Wukongarchaeota archaeon]
MGSKLKPKLIRYLKGTIPEPLLGFLPRGYAKIGHVMIVNIPEILKNYEVEIAEILLKMGAFSGIKTVAKKAGRTKGIYRMPQIKVLAGEKQTETLHRENDTMFKLDPARITFSPGNHNERKRMIDIANNYETIVDLFACVGNLSLPIAVHKNVIIYAIEKNPEAYKYLLENIKINKLENRVIPLFGDNRDVTPKNVADRVIMGYLYPTIDQLEIGIKALKNIKGGWIHFHIAKPLNKLKEPETLVKKVANKLEYDVCYIKKLRVKHYAPSIEHLVLDVNLKPRTTI